MKSFLSILALCLLYTSHSEAYRTETVHSRTKVLDIPPECERVIEILSQNQLQYLEKYQSRLEQDLALNQQHQGLLSKYYQISERGGSGENPANMKTVQEDIVAKGKQTPVVKGIIPRIITGAGNVAGEIANTAGQLAQDDVNFKAALIGGVLGGAGKVAANALHATGEAAAQAASHIEQGVDNILSNFD